MTEFDDRIRNLITLAQDESEQSRSLLFDHICDLFLQGRPMASAIQVQMLTEILKELLTQVTLSVRQKVAATLCSVPHPSEELVNIMCEDVVEVSGPLLEKIILPDEKLIHIIRYGTEAHRIHISRRFGLSPLVRHELDKAHQNAQSSRLKYSLNELDQQAEGQVPDMDEATTANILELLRAQHIHGLYSGLAPKPTLKSQGELRGELRGELQGELQGESKPEPAITTEAKTAKPVEETPTEYLPRPDISPQNTRADRKQDNSIIFDREAAANDAARPAAPSPQNSIIQSDSIIMEDNPREHEDGIWRRIENSQRETSRQREFVRTVADWFWEVDRSGLITFLSDEAFAVFGCLSTTLFGADFISLCARADDNTETDDNFNQPDQNLESLFERRSSFRNIPFYITAQNQQKTLWYLSAIAVFDIHTGRFSGFRGSGRAEIPEDPTAKPSSIAGIATHPEHPPENYGSAHALKSVEHDQQEARQIACNEEITAELLQNLSHEFRTPLNAIIGFSEMINMETWGSINEPYHQSIKNILAAAFQLKEAVNDVLDSAKLEAGLMQIAPESFSLKAVLKNCCQNVDTMAREKHLQFLDNDNNIDVVLYNDMQSVELCLTKMLTGIIRRANDGEVITLSVLINSNARIRIEMPVLGPEIEEKNAEEMFQKLENLPDTQKKRRKNDIRNVPKIASGFGLSIAQSLAHLIGGDISTHSAHGYLTHLVLTLRNHDPAVTRNTR